MSEEPNRRIRIRARHRRDFWTYIWFNRRINKRLGNKYYFCPAQTPVDPGKYDAITAFVLFESMGELLGTKHPRLLQLAFDGKQLLNFHIEMWAEGIADGTSFIEDFDNYLSKMPEWVKVAIEQQVKKIKYGRR